MRRVIGIDIHRTLEAVFWENGQLRRAGRLYDPNGTGGFEKSFSATDEVVIEATGNLHGGVPRALVVYAKSGDCQSAAGEGDRACTCRAMLVEAAWAAAKAPGPLHAFFVRVRARRGHRVAAIAVARKLTVLCWHMLTKQKDYFWARPSLVAHKTRSMELQAGQPQTKGNKRGPAYAYSVKQLRDQEMRDAEQADKHSERFIEAWRPRPPKEKARGASIRQGSNKAAWRYQPMRRASPRRRPRQCRIPWPVRKYSLILSMVCFA
ncbi:hypothetical protein [Mesorhizobium neociceri]|uniref:hypothetical protein n=1 Tax=Mesorhizobium neociceri TaxID=1307853 RepID=UPI0038B3567A